MLKRVPSVAFLSDVLEYDGVRLRGLDPGYTQILINGERVPGSGADRSFFVDRIPAELIERIEIVRSASANRSGDALAGTLNIVLRDAYALEGGFVRLGALAFNDGRIRESYGGAYGAAVGPGRLLIGANVQGRRNPKDKFSFRYGEPPASADTFDNREDQTDLRNGTDYSFNATYTTPFLGGELMVGGFFVRTEREQLERSIEYNIASGFTPSAIETTNVNPLYIEQDNWSLTGEYEFESDIGETTIKVGFARFTEQSDEFEDELEYLRDSIPFPELDRTTRDRAVTDLTDEEFKFKVEHERDFGPIEVELGAHYQNQTRNTSISERRNRFNAGSNEPNNPLQPIAGGLSQIEEIRVDPYLMVSREGGPVSWELGLRYETTDVIIEDETAAPGSRRILNDYAELLPSAHLRIDVSEQDRLSLSLARTVRRPNFDQLSPALLLGEFGDNDFIGNPRLNPETAWGVDAGYERRLGRQGVMGVNLFYRDIENLIEVFNTGAEGDEGPGSFVLSARNSGRGQVWGVELDLSTPLTAVNLDNTGVFLNYSWLDSSIDDEFGSRRFNDQSDFVLNAGFIQDIPRWQMGFGATYRLQGTAFGRIVGEEVTTEYGADLEVFVERTFGDRFVVRMTGSNLLDASKDETFNKFNTIDEQFDRDFDEFELETESAGPVIQLIGRLAF
jgi:outer membrane receptor protein involved in Fe transport